MRFRLLDGSGVTLDTAVVFEERQGRFELFLKAAEARTKTVVLEIRTTAERWTSFWTACASPGSGSTPSISPPELRKAFQRMIA